MSKAPIYVPRFRARAIPQGKAWGWELYITIGPDSPDGTINPITMASRETFLNKEAALTNLQKILPDIMKKTCEAMGLPEPAAVHDLQAGTLEEIEDWKNKKVPR